MFAYFSELLNVYLVLLFIIFPFYYERGFSNIGTAKGRFYRIITYYYQLHSGIRIPTFFLLCAVGVIWLIIYVLRHGGKKAFSGYEDIKAVTKIDAVDIFAIAYLVLTILACILTPYRKYFFWGFPRWYMGLLFQISIIVIYILASRFWKWRKTVFILMMAALFLIMLLGLMNHFKIDPMGFYGDFTNGKKRRAFFSLIGQRTVYSGYVATLFPIGVWLYMDAKNNIIKSLSAVFLVIGFASIATCNASSSFLGLAGMFTVLFCVSFMDNRYMKAFLETVLIMLLSWRLVGILQNAFPDRTGDAGLESMMLFVTQRKEMWALILAVAAAYGAFLLLMRKNKIDVTKLTAVRNILIAFLFIFIALVVLYIILNTKELLPEKLRSSREYNHSENYLIFNGIWGNHRGGAWIASFRALSGALKDDPVRFILGAGPDEYYEIVMHYCGDYIKSIYNETVVNCAHNEWLDRFVNGGILGGAAYAGIFVSSFFIMMRKTDKHRELAAILACMASYAAHNFFCYQRMTCTPYIFTLIGVGMCIVRYGKVRTITE